MNSPSYTGIRMLNVTKCFSKVIANRNVNLELKPGEVLALLGENGAGKSTIMKILYGLYAMDEGQIWIDGRQVQIKSPADARRHGIAMVQQHFSLVPVHTVSENVLLGNSPAILFPDRMNKAVQQLSEEYGFDIPADRKVGGLSVGQQQKVEILKALYTNARVLILDEPTAVLTPGESESLMKFIRAFADKGNSVVFITHKMKEVIEVADRVVVMRNGQVAGERDSDLNEKDLARLMIGADIKPPKRSTDTDYGKKTTVLCVENVSLKDRQGVEVLANVSFRIRKGEIYGIAGVSGNGQDELCNVICGLSRPDSGKVRLLDNDVTDLSIRRHNELGLGYVPVDRHRDAMVMDMTLSENILLRNSFSDTWVRRGFVKKHELDTYTSDLIQRHRIKASGPDDTAGSLSGGNQQKLVLAREVDIGSSLLVFNQPVRGLDMGASDRIHQVILEQRAEGKAILLVSTEISELFELCDSIAVMYRGRIAGEFRNGEVSAHDIGLLMAGGEI